MSFGVVTSAAPTAAHQHAFSTPVRSHFPQGPEAPRAAASGRERAHHDRLDPDSESSASVSFNLASCTYATGRISDDFLHGISHSANAAMSVANRVDVELLLPASPGTISVCFMEPGMVHSRSFHIPAGHATAAIRVRPFSRLQICEDLPGHEPRLLASCEVSPAPESQEAQQVQSTPPPPPQHQAWRGFTPGKLSTCKHCGRSYTSSNLLHEHLRAGCPSSAAAAPRRIPLRRMPQHQPAAPSTPTHHTRRPPKRSFDAACASDADGGFLAISTHPAAKRLPPTLGISSAPVAAVDVDGTVFFDTSPPSHPPAAIAAAEHRRKLATTF